MSEDENLAAFAPENPLETAMVAAAEDPQRFDDFMSALREGDVMVPGQKPVDHEGERVTEGDENISLPVVDWQGHAAVPVFSSVGRLRRAVPEAPSYMAFHFSDLAANWTDHWMILNPGNEVGIPLPPELIRGETDRVTLDAGSEIVIGEPAVIPGALIATIVALLRGRPEVVAAHCAEVLIPGAVRPELVVGLELDDPSEFESLATAFTRELQQRGSIGAGFCLVQRDHPDTIAAWMIERDQPLHRRG
ncbi:MAG: enhanced serine sensitivity protein SseB C-terminal domain-containing protein [Candidatus Dormibacteria bacterium]